jgi:hypothetical protein
LWLFWNEFCNFEIERHVPISNKILSKCHQSIHNYASIQLSVFFWKILICIRKESNIHEYEGHAPSKQDKEQTETDRNKRVKIWQRGLGSKHEHAAWTQQQTISKQQGK